MTDNFNDDLFQNNMFKMQSHFMLLKSPSQDGYYVEENWAAEDYNEEREVQELQRDNYQFDSQFQHYNFDMNQQFAFDEKYLNNKKLSCDQSFQVAFPKVVVNCLSNQNDSLSLMIEEEANQSKSTPSKKIEVQKIEQKSVKIQKKYPNKNFCRYIMLSAFRALESSTLQNNLEEIMAKNKVSISELREYFSKQKFLINGYQLLKKELIIDNGDSDQIQNRKKAFKEFLLWYLTNLSTRDILSSKKDKKHIKAYLNYKNNVMFYYIQFPEQWTGNSANWKI